MGGSARGRQDYERHGKGCIFRGKTGAVGVVLIAELCSRSAEVVGKIFLDIGERLLSAEGRLRRRCRWAALRLLQR